MNTERERQAFLRGMAAGAEATMKMLSPVGDDYKVAEESPLQKSSALTDLRGKKTSSRKGPKGRATYTAWTYAQDRTLLKARSVAEGMALSEELGKTTKATSARYYYLKSSKGKKRAQEVILGKEELEKLYAEDRYEGLARLNQDLS